MCRVYVIFLFVVLFFHTSFSQNQIAEVLIKENRLLDKSLPISKTNKIIISKDEIKKMSVQNISDVLHFVSGLQINRRGNNNSQTDVKINGGTFEQTLILINGHPILDPQTGHHFMNLPITENDIEQIEIVTGPQAFIYGVNGIAGAINIVTKKIKQNEIILNTYVGSSFEKDTFSKLSFLSSNLHFGIANASKFAKQYITFSSDIGNGFMYNTATKNFKTLYTSDFTLLKNNHFSVLASYIKNEFGANGFYAPPYDINAIEKVNTFFGALNHEKIINKNWLTKSNFSYRNNLDNYIFRKSEPSYYQNKHKSNSYFANSNLNYRYKNNEIGFGLFYNYQNIKSTNLDSFSRENMGAYTQFVFNKNKTISASSGIYLCYNAKWGLQLLPGIDVWLKANDKLNFNLSLGTANRLPTYTDLYYVGPSNIGNSELNPEKSLGLDARANYKTTHLFATVHLFKRKINDIIDWTKPINLTTWRPNNFGLQTVNGFNFSFRYHFKNENKISLQQVFISYQYLDISVKNNLENEISKYNLDFFKHQLIAYCTINFSKNIFLTSSMRYQNRFNYNDYLVFDSRINFEKSNTILFLDINNIGNEKYLEINAFPMPSRWFTLGFRKKFNY